MGAILKVLDIRHLLTVVRTGPRISPTASATINVEERELTDLYFELPNGFKKGIIEEVALPSLCSFHWKEERERYDQLTVEIPATEQQSACHGYFVNRYTFIPRKSYNEPPMLNLISSTKVFPKVFPSPSPSYWLRSAPFFPNSLSGRSIILYSACENSTLRDLVEGPRELVLTTMIDESSTDADYSQGQPSLSFRVARSPKWLPETWRYKIDYLSGAVIYTSEDKRGIKIAYPA